MATLRDEVEIELAERREERVRVAQRRPARHRVGGLEAVAGACASPAGRPRDARPRARARDRRARPSAAAGARDAAAGLNTRTTKPPSPGCTPRTLWGSGCSPATTRSISCAGVMRCARLAGGPASSVRRRGREDIGIVNLPRSSGILLHVTSLPGGRLGTPDSSSSIGWRLQGSLVADPAARAARPLGLAVHVDRRPSPAGPGCSPQPAAPVSDGRSSARSGRARVLDRRLGALRRGGRRRRPGALRARVERAAALCGRARRAPDRRHPALCRPGSADQHAHPGLFQRGVVAGAPPDALARAGQLWGNPLYDWRERAEGYRWWIERLRRAVRAGRPRPHRPLPRIRRVLVDPRAARAMRARAAGGAARAARCSPQPGASSASSR